MDTQKEREAFEAWFESKFESTKLHKFDDGVYWHERAQMSWEAWQTAKAQAVPETQQALNDRLLVKSIREHVESHISEISVNDLFDKEWLAAMKCIQHNIDMLEAQEQKFNLDEFLTMEEKLKHKGGVIEADLDCFIAYTESVLSQAKALKEPK